MKKRSFWRQAREHLTVKGDDLKVNRLTVEQGEVDIGGRVDSFSYAQIRERRGQGESFFSRLFG